jgi:hypothetical protein
MENAVSRCMDKPNFASSRRFGGNLVVFGSRMKVGFLGATPYGQQVGLFAGGGKGVVVKTLPFGTPWHKATIRACSFARAIAGRTESGTPTGR